MAEGSSAAASQSYPDDEKTTTQSFGSSSHSSLTPSASPGLFPDSNHDASAALPCDIAHPRPRRRPIPRKGHNKSRLGCYNCKRRRVKCPETLPACEPCHRLGLRCSYPQTEVSQLVSLPVVQSSSSRPRGALSQGHGQLSMTDLHFFHHFLFHAYPGLPICGEKIWHEVAQYSHGFDFLAHAILALGASHLSLCASKDYTSPALTHRVTAITSLNAALITPCKTREEGDARYAALMALTFQSSYMADGMQEFLMMLRGCSVFANSSLFKFEESAFRVFSIDSHVQRLVEINGGFDMGFSDPATLDAALKSLRAIAPLSSSVLEIAIVSTLQRILQMSRASTVGAFSELCRAYALFSEASPPDFSLISDPKNHVAQVLLCHFFVIEYILATTALAPVSLSFRFQRNVVTAWAQQVSLNVPGSFNEHVKWPLTCIARSDRDWDLRFSRQKVLEEACP